jgi:pimeloyl-ACP methyl ester carboxylesterase
MTIQDRRIELAGQRLRYREAGAPDSPALILLHQLGQDSRDWDAVSAALCDRFRVLALDLRGHGESSRAGPYSFEHMRDDVCRFADRLNLEAFSLIGHSMGGTVAFLVAEEWPDRIESLVVEDTPPPRGANLPEPPAEPPSAVAFDWSLARAIVSQLNDPDPRWWDRLSSIRARTLIIGGGDTSPIPQPRLKEVTSLIPGARLVTIDGAGHLVHATKPDQFIPLVREFLTQRDPE